MLKTLEDICQLGFMHDAKKHGLGLPLTPEEYARGEIDRMSNSEFLALLSSSLDEWRLQESEEPPASRLTSPREK